MAKHAKRGRAPVRAKEERGLLPEMNPRLYAGLAALVLLLTAFLCLDRLGTNAVMNWDEARHGVSAYEMGRSGDYIVNTYGGEPDYWNLKPPLSFWLIALSNKLFGPTVLSMRLYSAVSFVLMVAAVMVFCLRRYGRLESLLAGALSAGCAMFHYLHFAHHGDADALFVLLTTLCLLTMATLREKPGRAVWCGLLFALAFLTKSWHALFLAAVGGTYFLVGRLYKVLKPAHYLGLLAGAILPLAAWGAARWSRDGLLFFENMVNVDLLARVSQTVERHGGSPLYYVQSVLKNTQVAGLLAAGFGAYLLGDWLTGRGRALGPPEDEGTRRLRGDLPALLMWILVPFVLFSAVKTKLLWYIFPAIVPIAMLTGVLAARALRDSRVVRWGKALLVAVVALTLAWDVRAGILTRGRYPADELQLFFTNEAARSEQALALRSRPAYLQVRAGPYNDLDGVMTEWEQRTQFLGETALDLRCLGGGAQAMRDGPADSVLIIERSLLEENPGDGEGLSEAYGGERYVCLVKGAAN